MENNKPTNEIQVELSEEMAQGTYANLAIISHSSSEFILDFIRVVPDVPFFHFIPQVSQQVKR